MAERRGLDRQAGAPPQIQPSGDSVTFHIRISGVRPNSNLLLRCDEAGNVWASIGKGTPAPSPDDSQAH